MASKLTSIIVSATAPAIKNVLWVKSQENTHTIMLFTNGEWKEIQGVDSKDILSLIQEELNKKADITYVDEKFDSIDIDSVQGLQEALDEILERALEGGLNSLEYSLAVGNKNNASATTSSNDTTYINLIESNPNLMMARISDLNNTKGRIKVTGKNGIDISSRENSLSIDASGIQNSVDGIINAYHNYTLEHKSIHDDIDARLRVLDSKNESTIYFYELINLEELESRFGTELFNQIGLGENFDFGDETNWIENVNESLLKELNGICVRLDNGTMWQGDYYPYSGYRKFTFNETWQTGYFIHFGTNTLWHNENWGNPPIEIPQDEISDTIYYINKRNSDVFAWSKENYEFIKLTEGQKQDFLKPQGADLLVPITWKELKDLRDSNNLIPGQKYRITDYHCTTTQEGTESADHQFDIIVTALSNNVLSENASAIQHEGDEYFANNNLAAWELKYCIDNKWDTGLWATGDSDLKCLRIGNEAYSNLYLRDEYNDIVINNIKYYSWEFKYYSSSDNKYTISENPVIGDSLYKYYDYKPNEISLSDTFVLDIIDYSKFQGYGIIYYMKDEFNNECYYDFKNILYDGAYTFSKKDNEFDNISDASLIGKLCNNNKIIEGEIVNETYPIKRQGRELPYIKIYSKDINSYYSYNNTILNCRNLTFLGHDNTFITSSGEIAINYESSNNIVIFSDLSVFPYDCNRNYFYNVQGSNFKYSVHKSVLKNILITTINGAIVNSEISNVQYSTINDKITNTTIYGITSSIINRCTNTIIGKNCININICNCENVKIGDNVSYFDMINSNNNNSYNNTAYNIQISDNIKGTSSDHKIYTISELNTTLNSPLTIVQDSNAIIEII